MAKKTIAHHKHTFLILIILVIISILEIIYILGFRLTNINYIQTPVNISKDSRLFNSSGVPNNPAVNYSFLKAVSIWPYYQNQKTSLINTISGVFAGFEQKNDLYYIKLNGTPRIDIRGIGLTKGQWDLAKVYDSTKSTNLLSIKITDLKPGDYILVNEIFDNTHDLTFDSPTSLTITKIKPK